MDSVGFRLARPEDVAGIVDLYDLFFHASDYPNLGLTFDAGRMQKWTWNAICGGYIPHLVAIDRDTNIRIGVLCYGLDTSCSTEPFAALDKFFVLPKWRFSAVARILLSLALEAARADGAVAFRAGLSAGTGAARNLFQRLGFEETPGSVLLARRL
jgi:GNAT superfamily N-acetyltransferase